MQWLKTALLLGATVGLVAAGSSRIMGLPPFGRLLDPFVGFWQNAEDVDSSTPDRLEIAGLQGQVRVVYDDRRVPHVLADNDHDLYFAQGYLVARDRLFQIDILSRVPAGRLAEILGAGALQVDRFHRRLGLRAGAEASLALIGRDSVTAAVLSDYSAGVNAYIASLTAAELPLEYKLLASWPEPWSPLRSLMVQQYMVSDLSGLSLDRLLTHVRERLGESAVESAFPPTLAGAAPIVPHTRGKKSTSTLPAPRSPFSLVPGPTFPSAGRSHGASNNWAIAGGRTSTGSPLLSSDPHLSLTLPSIWYEVQLTAPDLDTYGVSIPGLPGVIIGFTRQVAWGITNSNADVLDWFQLKLRDGSPEYEWDGAWRPARISVEEIVVRDVGVVQDTLLWTEHGPVVRRSAEKAPDEEGWPSLYDMVPPDCAMRWLAHVGGNEVRTFYLLNRASSAQDVKAALQHFVRPAQNFVYATTQGDIGMQVAGRLPHKRPGEGRYVRDGSKSETAGEDWLSPEQNPGEFDPARGYVFSANQHPVDESYGNYLGFNFSYYRARRLQDRLAMMHDATPDSMRALQFDKHSLHAESLLPRLLETLDPDRLRPIDRPVLELLKAWNYENRSDAVAPTIFSGWWKRLNHSIWHDELGQGWACRLQEKCYPTRARVVEMAAAGGTDDWFDDIRTPQKETFADLAQSSFAATADSLRAAFGPMGPPWAWSSAREERIMHLLGIGAFSRAGLQTGGGAATLNAVYPVSRSKQFQGPSWRMVVSLEPEGAVGWGVHPGGQSGNPGSRFYDDGVQNWEAGELNELMFIVDHEAQTAYPTLIMESR
jgi:penicillin amidase